MTVLARNAAASKKKKPKGGKPKGVESDVEDEVDEGGNDKGMQVAEVDPDAWMEDEFGPTKVKGKGKKGGKKQQVRKEESDEEDAVLAKGVEAVTLDAEATTAVEPVAPVGEEDNEPSGVLTKKQKEQIKKDKEKVAIALHAHPRESELTALV